MLDPPFPDPRAQPEVRQVTSVVAGWSPTRRSSLAAITDSLAHWPDLRAVGVEFLSEHDDEQVARFADHEAATRLESLSLLDLGDSLLHSGLPTFRPPAGRPWRLRHVAVSGADLAYLLRSGLVPDLRSADVLVRDLDEARGLAARPELAQLERLGIGSRCGWNGESPLWEPFAGNVIEQDDDACAAFFAAADLSGLRELVVRGVELVLGRVGLGARGVEAIVACGVLGRMTALTLELLPIHDPTIALVVGSLDHQRVESLTLADLVATDRTAAAFAAAGAFPRLRHLDLSRNNLDALGAALLATEVDLPVLEHLDLSGRGVVGSYYGNAVQPIGDKGVSAWANSRNTRNLTTVKVSLCGLGVEGITALLTSTTLPALTTLNITGNLCSGWPAALRDAPVWRTLRTLDLTGTGFDGEEISALVLTAEAPELRSVLLDYNSVGSGAALAQWPLLPQLWELSLHDTAIDDDGLRALAVSGAARSLLELDLEQDCSNRSARHTPLPPEVIERSAFPSLDTIFLGIVDEYHGARYRSGFTTAIRERLTADPTTRPELLAYLVHLDLEELNDDAEWETKVPETDPRAQRLTNHRMGIERAREFIRHLHT
ncbi:hypothetical protein [Actinokineospora terrae]|nr:hypothetical protein [Actinokineospora terrae]